MAGVFCDNDSRVFDQGFVKALCTVVKMDEFTDEKRHGESPGVPQKHKGDPSPEVPLRHRVTHVRLKFPHHVVVDPGELYCNGDSNACQGKQDVQEMPVAQVEFRIEYQCIEIDHEQQKGSDEIFLVQDAVCGGANQSVVGEQEQEEDAEEQLCHYAEKNGNADFHTLFFRQKYNIYPIKNSGSS